MFSNLISLPVMLLLSVIQSAAISRISILGGTADIVLLAIISRAVSDDEGNLVKAPIIEVREKKRHDKEPLEDVKKRAEKRLEEKLREVMRE